MVLEKRKRQPRGLLEEGMPGPDWPARMTQWAFLLVVILVGARALMSESLREPFEPIPGGLVAPGSPGPGTSLMLDLLCWIPALLVLARRLLDRTYVVRYSASHAMMGGVAVWMVLSVFWASDRFAAMVGAANFVSALAVLWAGAQLVRSWGRLRFVGATAFALLLVYVAAGLNQRLVNHPVHVRNWNDPNSETSRWRYMKERGLTEDDFQFKQFESNILTGSLQLFGTSANTYAAATVLLGVVGLSLAIQRRANGDGWWWVVGMVLPAPVVGFVLYHTHSMTAGVTPVVAAAGLIGIWRWRGWLGANSAKAYWMGVALVFVGALAVIGHGVAHNSLVMKTLTFRWYYWTGAAKLLAAHPIGGVGWGNFGDYYPGVRQAIATEEVRDPHNFVVRFFAELGVVGGLLAVGWFLRMAWEMTRPIQPSEGRGGWVQGNRRGMVFLMVPAVLMGLLSFVFGVDLWSDGSYVLLEGAYRFLAVGLLLAGYAAGALRSLADEKLDERPSPWLMYGMLVGLGVFLLHNCIDFSMFETGPMFLFALLSGSVLGIRQASLAGQKRRTWIAASVAGIGGAMWLAAWFFLWLPTALAGKEADAGDAAMRSGRFGVAAAHYGRARSWMPLEGEYAYRAAQALSAQGASRGHVEGVIELAIQANPRALRYHVARAELEMRRAKPEKAVVEEAYGQAVRLDPKSVRVRIQYAEAMAKLKEREAALEQYREALRLDDLLPVDEVKRLGRRRVEIEKAMAGLGV